MPVDARFLRDEAAVLRDTIKETLTQRESRYEIAAFEHADQSGLWAFYGAFAKSQKVSITFIMSVRPSYWTDFYEIWYLDFFRKSVEKIQVSLKPDKNNGHFTWRRFHINDNMSLNSS
jgi:hypothetical protein